MKPNHVTLSILASLLCFGCQDPAASEVSQGDGPPAQAQAEPTAAESPAAGGKAAQSTPGDGGTSAGDEGNRIVSMAASQGRADSGCAFVIQYSRGGEQPWIWESDGECEGLTAEFIAVSRLEEIGQIDDLAPVDAGNIRSSPGGTVFYIEDGLTSSAFPLDDENFIYEVVLAD